MMPANRRTTGQADDKGFFGWFEIADIKMGYFLWLIAYGLLVAAHLWKEPVESLGSVGGSAFGCCTFNSMLEVPAKR